MALSPGTRLGSYEIDTQIGAGGMGEVYRARDTRLDRFVAVKVLPAHIAHSPDLRERFEREARTLASLSHPHICPVFDVGRQAPTDGAEPVDFLVMEFLDGETLADRLTRTAGALRLEDVLRYAIQIADALDKAHRTGIVHRDLKPGNVMLTKAGAVLLDFGLAKAVPASGAVAGMSIAATMTRPLTAQGAILGTLHYMAPEQVEGKDADARSDLFAFGAVVYEMATGRKAFDGKSAASIVAAILEREPPALSTLQPLTPPALDHVVMQCLAKDPEDRWQTAGDVMRELKWAAERASQTGTTSSETKRVGMRERLAWAAALAAALVAAIVLALWPARPTPSVTEMRVEITTPPTNDPVTLAISPDGRKIVFSATVDGQPRLFLRSLESTEARPLSGTDRGRVPFWSADNRTLGFFADGKFKRLDLETDSVTDLHNAVASTGATWNREGVMLIGQGNVQPIWRVPAGGGEPVPVTQNAAGISHRTPHFLPDGRHFLYSSTGSPNATGVYVSTLDGSEPRQLLNVDTPAAYASEHLFYMVQGTLVARPFDVNRLAFTGEPVRLADGVANFSVSTDGSIAYRQGTSTGLGATGVRELTWFDRSGRSLGTLATSQAAGPPLLSPDGRHVALHQAGDVWVLETTREGRVRFTTNTGTDSFPVWSPDGASIAFQSYQKGLAGEIYRKSASGNGPEERVISMPGVTHPMDWSEDGRFLLFRTQPQAANSSQWNLWAAPLTGDKPFAVVETNFDERDGQFSPDGKWIAFESNESGRYEIYIQPFPDPGAKVPVSSTGGAQVRWRRDGKELFYVALDGRLMAVPIRLVENGPPEIGASAPLFMTNIGGAITQGVTRQQYTVSADGQRFLMHTLVEDANAAPITLIFNWKPK